MAIVGAALPSILGIGAGIVASKILGGDKQKMPDLPPLPQPPNPEEAADKAAENIRRKRAAVAASSKSIYSSPLGTQGEATVARKTLLGT